MEEQTPYGTVDHSQTWKDNSEVVGNVVIGSPLYRDIYTPQPPYYEPDPVSESFIRSIKLEIGFVKVKDNTEDAGWDFYVPNDFEKTPLCPGENIAIPAGLHVKLPSNEYALIGFNKSGIAKKGIVSAGQVIDYGYQGEVHICVVNVSNSPIVIEPGMKLQQFILLPVPQTKFVESNTLDELYENHDSIRGTGGFGSTGLK